MKNKRLKCVSEPSGKPRVTAAHNTSSTSLYISWQAPDLNTIHGEFLGYKISYRPRDVNDAKAVEIPVDNPKATVSKCFCFRLFHCLEKKGMLVGSTHTKLIKRPLNYKQLASKYLVVILVE